MGDRRFFVVATVLATGCGEPYPTESLCVEDADNTRAEVVPIEAHFSDDGQYLFFEMMRLGPDNEDPRFAGEVSRVLSYRMHVRDAAIVLLTSTDMPSITKASFYDDLDAAGDPHWGLDRCATSPDGRYRAKVGRSNLACFPDMFDPSECLAWTEHTTPLEVVDGATGSAMAYEVGLDASRCSDGTMFPPQIEGCDGCAVEADAQDPPPCVVPEDTDCGAVTEDGTRFCCRTSADWDGC